MSTPTPGPSRRRRIAGERRPGRPDPADPADPTTPTTPTTESDAGAEAPPAAPPSPPVAPPRRADSDPAAERETEATAEANPETTDEAAPQASPEARPRSAAARAFATWWGSRASLVVLSGILLLAVVLTALLGLGLLGNRSVDEVREAEATQKDGRAATAAAERAAGAIVVYNYKSLEADQATAEKFMTEEFRAEYGQTFEDVVAPAAEKSRADVTADVKGAAVLRAAQDRVRVLLFVDQTTVSTAHDGPQVSLNRIEMEMVERSGTWLVDDISTY